MSPSYKEFHVCFNADDVPGMLVSHIHRALEIILVLSDNVHCAIGEREFILRANTLVLLSNLERHRLNVPGSSYHRHACAFLPSFVGMHSEQDLLACFFQSPEAGILPLEPREAAQFIQLFGLMEDAFSLPEGEPGRRRELQLLLETLLLRIARRQRSQSCPAARTDGAYTRISLVIAYIQEHLRDGDLSLQGLSRRFTVSRTQLAADFKSVTGTTIHQYILDCRIACAVAMMEDGMSAEAAGQYAGFGAAAHFSRCFKSRVGVSPMRYMRARRG